MDRRDLSSTKKNAGFGALAICAFAVWTLLSPLGSPVVAKTKTPPKAETNPHVAVKTTHGTFTIALLPEEAPKTVANFLGLATGQKVFVDYATNKRTKRPFYDGLTFHRVIAGAMIQGGCPAGDGTGRPGYVFEDEINARALGLDRAPVLDARGVPHASLQIADEDDFYKKVVDPLLRVLGVRDSDDFRRREGEIDARIRRMTLKEALENQGYRYTQKHTTRPILRGVVAMANSGPSTNGSQFFIATRPLPMLDGKHTPFGHVVAGMKVVETIARSAVDGAKKSGKPVRIISITPVAAIRSGSQRP